MASLLVGLLFITCCQAVQGVILLSDIPQSRNVSAGTSVNFTCATPETGLLSFTITTDVTLVNTTNNDVILPNGDRQLTLSFVASSEHQLINIVCIASRLVAMNMVDFNTSKAILMIQGLLSGVGNLTSSEVDHCTLHFTWTAPYTLQGVPINYYTINITRHSDGAVLRSDTTNTTEYLYTVSSLGETLEVVVAAVNGAGTGNVSSIITLAGLSSFKFMIDERIRLGDGWTFKSTMEVKAICNDYNKVTVHLHDENSGKMYNTTANITSLPDRRLVAHFHNIPEDTYYHASSKVHYTQRSTQHSNEVNTNTFDIDHVNYTIIDGALYITVGFVKGTEFHSFCVKVMCESENIFESLNGSNGVINNVPRNELCTLLITDVDAMNFTNLRPAFLAKIQVSGTTDVPQSTTIMNVNTSPTSITKDDNQLIIAVVAVIVVVVTVAIGGIIILLICVLIRFLKVKDKKKCRQQVPTKDAVASTPLSVVIDCEHDDAAPHVPSELFPNEPKLSNEKLYPSSGQAQIQRQNKKYNDQQSQPTYDQPTHEQLTQPQFADMAT